ncbi:Acetyl xylan esterase (AXE1) [Planctomycetes bacterium K23_9]|uniref:Acetyl xylan esterase (AXE1) n=2 Tax=Stieleria marina TaxID=1930275 RepID=A0A517NUV9_9BACT|nr:Acetyl xylan esterase (AXE1) [Planctomycetes bacterium K23_9]
MRVKTVVCLLAFCCQSLFATLLIAQQSDTLPVLSPGQTIDDFQGMWAGFDPRAESLQVETVREWEEDEVVLRIVRFQIGVFKGKTAKLAAVYGFPKQASADAKVPGLVQIHGGGQFADYKACLLNAKRGYATVSIAWAGRISAPGYRVDSRIVKLFWDNKTDDPDYKLTTDWGAVDGYHAPSRNQGNVFPSAKSAAWTIDDIESPRNSGWYLGAIAARRALTFLERQPEVDAERLGVYGHSMGGKLTVMASVDARVKAAAPSCGGISDRDNDSPVFRATLGDDVSLRHVDCPIIFLSPANDFHGRINDLPKAIDELPTSQWRLTCAPHHNHQDVAQYEVATLLWFDQHLKGSFRCPATPDTSLDLKTTDGVAQLSIRPDDTRTILSVDAFYTPHGKSDDEPEDFENTKHRFWHHAPASQSGDHWTAKLPVAKVDQPLWVYANVRYALDQPVNGAGYYYREYSADSFNLSSLLKMVSADDLQSSSVRPTLQPARTIEDFGDDWDKEWFTYRSEKWARSTHKLYNGIYQPSESDQLSIQVRCQKPNELIVMLDGFAAEVALQGNNAWQIVRLSPQDFKDFDGNGRQNWNGIKRLTLSDSERLKPERGDSRPSRIVGEPWEGEDAEFRNLCWTDASAETKTLPAKHAQ